MGGSAVRIIYHSVLIYFSCLLYFRHPRITSCLLRRGFDNLNEHKTNRTDCANENLQRGFDGLWALNLQRAYQAGFDCPPGMHLRSTTQPRDIIYSCTSNNSSSNSGSTISGRRPRHRLSTSNPHHGHAVDAVDLTWLHPTEWS